ncbi:MAG: hypothetical protein Kow0037_02350 [Calditrichia bacterium]
MNRDLYKVLLRKFVYIFTIISLVLLGVSCAPGIVEIPVKEPAHLGYVTSVHKELTNLPLPKEKIVAAVYKFRDQTGQYKTSSTGVSWSTAVTQGATSMLLKALEDSRWFTVIEREGLSNLLNERKIIRSSRENYAGQNGEQLPPLPPLLYAGIILEGGIISYETNTMTGGAGARYFGIGGSTQYRKDEVTIYLRAVSTQTGRVLKTVYTTKSILSMAVDANVYRYVRFKRLLEVETGFSVNEPPQMCVLEAIEKAVISLIVEGIVDNLWELADPRDIQSPIIANYIKEKDQILGNIDYNVSPNMFPRFLGIGLTGGMQKYSGDYSGEKWKQNLELFMRFIFSPKFALAINGAYGEAANKDNFSSRLKRLELQTFWTLLPTKKISPFIMLGGGLIDYSPKDVYGNPIPIDKSKDEPTSDLVASVSSGVGLEFFLNRSWSAHLTLEQHYLFTDQLDGRINGRLKDSVWGGKLGFTYFFK